MKRATALSLLLLTTLAAPAAAAPPADSALALRASASSPGRIALRVHASPGVAVLLRDDVTGATRSFTPSRADTVLRRFATWSCAASDRGFTATQAGLSVSAQVRTPGCAHRLVIRGRRVVRAGRNGVLLLRDRWRLGGIGVRFCVRPPGAVPGCRSVRVRRGERVAKLPYEALRPGAYRLFASNRYQRLHASVDARPSGGRLRLLATGDSMIQIVDSFLTQRLSHTTVESDARISTGISKPTLLDWQAHARVQARARPDVTVVFLGANDGFAMAGADCCGPPWIAEYARRARTMMRAYARGGRGRVYWLTLPAPRSGFFREVYPAVNAAIRQAAAGLEDDVKVIGLDQVFTPGNRYRKSMRIRGKRVKVRQGDGIHLNTSGASLAAKLVIRALRADRLLP